MKKNKINFDSNMKNIKLFGMIIKIYEKERSFTINFKLKDFMNYNDFDIKDDIKARKKLIALLEKYKIKKCDKVLNYNLNINNPICSNWHREYTIKKNMTCNIDETIHFVFNCEFIYKWDSLSIEEKKKLKEM